MITGRYEEYYKELLKKIPKERLMHDSLSTLAFGIDASFYRLIPKLVIKANNEEELKWILQHADTLNIPITFRAAGTSLSGQAITDSVLVIATHGWKGYEILDEGGKIRLQPGVVGLNANNYLARYGKKIGPDPASIDSAMIGGIAANNASGMCCGTSENSYKTVADIRVLLSDGTVFDTSLLSSLNKEDDLSLSHGNKRGSERLEKILSGLEELAKEVQGNIALKERIEKKFKIKNTTGYSLNALTDYSDGVEILKHLMIGSEGTLGFISDITFRTVTEHPHKALALMIYHNIEDACNAVMILKKQPVTAVEILDRASLRSVESTKGVPEYLKTLSSDACAILVETRGESDETLDRNVPLILDSIKHISTELPVSFTKDSREQALLWKIRKETLPTVAGMRKSGNTPLIEDICFPMERLAEGTLKLRALFEKHGYNDGVIFGHALEGNLHFMFNQDFQDEKEIERYSRFMDDVTDMVVNDYDGSLKAEHGTGRNMAPFVEKEWGEQAYSLMKRIKSIFDPNGILNPGVILNDDKRVHLKNLKPIPSTRETVDKCMECGFCETACVAEGFTLSPRQRVVIFKEIERLKATGGEPHRAAEIQRRYKYYGLDTCATDSLCYVKCPLKIDTGKLVKELRHEGHSVRGEKNAIIIAKNMDKVTAFMRLGLSTVYFLRLLMGKRLFGAIAIGMSRVTGGLIPLWNQHFPKGAKKIKVDIDAKSYTDIPLQNIAISAPTDSNYVDNPSINLDISKLSISTDADNKKVLYFPSCITRSMGSSRNYSKQPQLTEVTKMVIERAGYTVVYPENMNSLCCGMAYSSKGYVEAGKELSDKLEAALYKASDGGKLPILCDMSPCLYTMKSNFGERLKLYEPAEFIHAFIIEKLKIKPVDRKVAIFAVCSAKKMEVDKYIFEIAEKCAKEIAIMESNCCGFAGDRGFLLPALNSHGLRKLRLQSEGCSQGYSTSRTCEIGLSNHSGIDYSSIIYLVEEASRS